MCVTIAIHLVTSRVNCRLASAEGLSTTAAPAGARGADTAAAILTNTF